MAQAYMKIIGAHPDIPVPESQIIEIGKPFTPAKVTVPAGWKSLTWYKDPDFTQPFVDGTIVTEDMVTNDVLNLYGKWERDGSTISFEYSSDSEVTTDPLPESIIWPVNTKIYPKDLPPLSTPASESTKITGWYIDKTAEVLLDDNGFLVVGEGVTFYERAVAEELVSVAFDYAIGKAATGESTKEFPTSEKAGGFDRDILGEMDVLPANPILGKKGETVELPQVDNLFAGTDQEQVFTGWYASKVIKDGEKPITTVTLSEDAKAFALMEPKNPVEKVKVIYKIAQVYVPKVEDGEIKPSTDEYMTEKEAAALMPALPVDANVNKNGETDIKNYEWIDYAIKGSDYALVSPQVATERIGNKYELGGYYSDYETTCEQDRIISNIQNDTTVYIKSVKHEEQATAEGQQVSAPETFNVEYQVDGYADPAETEGGGFCPSDAVLPVATIYQPVEIDKETYPDLVDEFKPENPTACEGYEFKYYYFYDKDGNKVIFDAKTVFNIIKTLGRLILHPAYELVDIDKETIITLMVLTPETLGAPEDLTYDDVDQNVLNGITNPIVHKVGQVFDPKSLEYSELGDTFEISGFSTLENQDGIWTQKDYTKRAIYEATTIYVKTKSTLPEQLKVIYHNDETSEEAQLIAPAYDVELSSASDESSGDFGYEARPADIVSATEHSASNAVTKTLTGVYTDAAKTIPYDKSTTETVPGSILNLYTKIEDLPTNKFIVTVDYMPRNYVQSASNFKYEIPCVTGLPNKVTYTVDAGATGAKILETIGTLPTQKYWKLKNHEYDNCFWITKASDTTQTPEPFNTTNFTLNENIILYPQREADMSYEPSILEAERIDNGETLSIGRSHLAATTL